MFYLVSVAELYIFYYSEKQGGAAELCFPTSSPSDLFHFRVDHCQRLRERQPERGERFGVGERRERGRLWVWGCGGGGGGEGQEEEQKRTKEASAGKWKVADTFASLNGHDINLWLWQLNGILLLSSEQSSEEEERKPVRKSKPSKSESESESEEEDESESESSQSESEDSESEAEVKKKKKVYSYFIMKKITNSTLNCWPIFIFRPPHLNTPHHVGFVSCRQLNLSLLPNLSRKRTRKRRKKCLCLTLTIVSFCESLDYMCNLTICSCNQGATKRKNLF